MAEATTTTERVAARLQEGIDRALQSGAWGERARYVLRGEWMGHPLHPVLVDTTIGFWSAAVTLDILRLFGMKSAERASDILMGLGLMSVPASAAAGMAEWYDASGKSRKTGLIHASFNTMATLAFLLSMVLKAKGMRKRGILAGFAGGTLASVGGYLGGQLVFRQQMGVRSSE